MDGLSAYHQTLLDARARAQSRSLASVKAARAAVGFAADDTALILGLNEELTGAARLVERERLRKLDELYASLGQELRAGIVGGVEDTARDVARSYTTATDGIAAANGARLSASFSTIPVETLEQFTRRATMNGTSLLISPDIWAIEQVSEIELRVAAALARGQSAEQLAQDLDAFLVGGRGAGVGGSISAQAMRIARTEINVAYWESSVRSAQESEIVAGQQWNLSGSHPRWDACDALAWSDAYNMGAGIYPAGNVPPRPHPNCFCHLIDVLRDVDDWDTPRPPPPPPGEIRIDQRGLPARMRGKIGGATWTPDQLAAWVAGKPQSERLHLTVAFAQDQGALVTALTHGRGTR